MEPDLRQAMAAIPRLILRPWWRLTRLFAILFFFVGVMLLTMSFWVPLLDPAPVSYPNAPFPVVAVHEGMDRTTVVFHVLRCTRAKGGDVELSYTYSFQKTNTTTAVPGQFGIGRIPADTGCITTDTGLTSQFPLSPGEWIVTGRTTVQTRWRLQEFNWRSQPFVVE